MITNLDGGVCKEAGEFRPGSGEKTQQQKKKFKKND